MAELAVGLSKSVVAGAITKVQSAIEEDAKLRAKAKRDLVFINMEFEMMESFLDDASHEMVSEKRKLVATWVKHIRQLVYEVEDMVENVVNLDGKPMFGLRFLTQVVPCMAAELPLDLAVKELEQLKGRVQDVNKSYRRYNLLDYSEGSKLANVIQKQQQQLPPPPPPGASHMLAEARDATRRQQGLLGLIQLTPEKMWQQGFSRLIQLMTEGGHNDRQVISVWGAEGDQGTTSIIRMAYSDTKVHKVFTYRSWVKLAHPLSPQDFTRSLLAQFYACSIIEEDTTIGPSVLRKMLDATQEDVFVQLEKLVTRKRYLIILEGLSNMLDWDAMRAFLPNKMNGSCIIVSTQQPEIASLCVGHPYRILELKRFSAEHSVCALFKEPTVVVSKASPFTYGQEREVKLWMSNSPLARYNSQMDNDTMPKSPLGVYNSHMKDELVNHLSIARSSRSGVMSVLGMAGLGKSDLVRSFYYDQMLQGKEFEKYIWVDVSHPLNLRDLSRSLLSECYSEQDPFTLLEQNQCLVVIDDLQYKEEWDLVQDAFVSRHSASVIIVITTETTVATYCTNNKEQVLNLQCLQASAAYSLFEMEVRRIDPSFCLNISYQDSNVWKLIKKCGGLPGVIIAVAGLVASQIGRLNDSVCYFNGRFVKGLEELGSLRTLFSWVHHFIVNPSDFLKPCIFYLSIFSRENKVRRRRIISRWIAEGYSKNSVEREAEENAEKFFSELIQVGIFLQVPQLAPNDEIMVFCEVNGFIREYVIALQEEANLVFKLGGNCPMGMTTQSICRHLVVLENWVRDEVLFKSIDFSRLWSVTVFGEWKSFFISESMKLLRVLDLEDASGVEDADLDKMVKLLRCLKFLSIRGCIKISRLPCSIGNLEHLQTLDVRGTSIVTLPASTSRLHKLHYIRAGSTSIVPAPTPPCFPEFYCTRHLQLVGVKVLARIGNMRSLHTLGVVNITASGGRDILKELKEINQLRKLGVSGINRKNINMVFSTIQDHVHLESLSVQLEKNNQDCLDGIPLSLNNLRSLKLYGLNNKLPKWGDRLSKLTKLDLELATLVQDDILFLGKLQQLFILRIKLLQHGELHFCVLVNGEEEDTYEKVKVLEIAGRCTLHVAFGSKSMKKLELLKVDCCGGSPLYQINDLENLTELRQVLLLNASNAKTLRKDLQGLVSELRTKTNKDAVRLDWTA